MDTYYLLLIDGQPAGQDIDGYTWFAGGRNKATTESSLQRIRKRINAADAYNRDNLKTSRKYSYCLVNTPPIRPATPAADTQAQHVQE